MADSQIDKPRQKPGTKPGDNWKMTDEVLRKLEIAAAMDCSYEEMAFFAEIATSTLYRWMEQNNELSENLDRLRARPILLARQTVIESMQTVKNKKGETTKPGDAKVAMEYLKSKRRQEFATKTEVENSGQTAVTITYVHPRDTDPAISEAAPGVADTSEPDDN